MANPTKHAIFDAALDLFSRRGYDATSVPSIAAHAGIAVGSVYRHFGGKSELFNQLYRRQRRALWTAAFAGMPAASDSAGWFRRFWLNLAGAVHARPQAWDFLSLHQTCLDLDAESRALDVELAAPLAAFFEAGRAAGRTRDLDPDVCIALVFGCFGGLMTAARTGSVSVPASAISAAGDAVWAMMSAQDSPVLTGILEPVRLPEPVRLTEPAAVMPVQNALPNDWRMW